MRKKKKKIIGSYAAISANKFAANMRLISNLKNIDGGKIKILMIGDDVIHGLWIDLQSKFSVSSIHGLASVEERMVDQMLEIYDLSDSKETPVEKELIKNGIEIEEK